MEVTGLEGDFRDEEYQFNPFYVRYSFDDMLLNENVKWRGDV
jgi:hypothetical protein